MAPLKVGLIAAFGVNALALAFDKRASVASVPDDVWDSFNASVSGNLRNGEPMLAPCFARYNGELQTADLGQCATVQTKGGDLSYASGQFGTYLNSQWGNCQANGESCTLAQLRPDILTPILDSCEQGSVPTKYVDLQNVENVQKTLKFAGDRGLRLVVKNTGHDYSGRSSAPDSLALWMHNLQPPIELDEEFTPDGCDASTGPTITFGAGQQFGGIYDFVQERGYRVVGGSSLTVGAAGGWITGGGHSILTNELGLGVDNVQQLKAVLPNGDLVTANRCQNQDLFFALRGGGGGTFAVITEMTTRVHPIKEMQFVQMTFITLGPLAQAKLLDFLVDNGLKWADEGWGGYISIVSAGVTSVFLGTALINHAEAVESMKPLKKFATTLNLGLVEVKTTTDYREEIYTFADTIKLGYGPGTAWAVSSRIIPRDTFADETKDALSSSLHDILNKPPALLEPSNRILSICLTMPSTYSKDLPESDQPGGPGHASIAPHWRNSVWQALHFRTYDGTITNPKVVRKIAQNAHDAMNPLRELTPNSGAYINEADPWEPDHVNSFWGAENYEKLLRVKNRLDPDNLLMVHQGVGWDESDGRFGCYPYVDAS
ncbi:hypothetical protein BDV19DRAFT_400467 [Aspergillus venezuelensis]